MFYKISASRTYSQHKLHKQASMLLVTIALSAVLSAFAEAQTPNLTDFQCPSRGRFMDDDDPECRRYFLCTQRNNGQLAPTPYYCPMATMFDRNMGVCTTTATCEPKTTEMPTTTPISNDDETDIVNFTCPHEGRFQDTSTCDCGWFFSCNKQASGIVPTRLYCPPATKFDPELGSCSYEYECKEEFTCTREGLFLDDRAVQGDRYYNCSKLPDGTLYRTHHTCPYHNVFVPAFQKCETIQDEADAPFQCKESGRFADPKDQICKSYYSCNGTSEATRYVCPPDYNFDPKLRVCTIEYLCPNDANFEKWASSFKCTRRGYFRNAEDLSCSTYFFCDVLDDHDGTMYRYNLRCPIGYIFDASRNLCSDHALCSTAKYKAI